MAKAWLKLCHQQDDDPSSRTLRELNELHSYYKEEWAKMHANDITGLSAGLL